MPEDETELNPVDADPEAEEFDEDPPLEDEYKGDEDGVATEMPDPSPRNDPVPPPDEVVVPPPPPQE